MSEILRTQSGVDGDGATLVGQALGGEVPKLRLNNLQSQSDKDEQKGFEHLVRGIYIGIRNPRVHDQSRGPDTRKEADTLILFVDFVCRKLLEGQLPFTVDAFLATVFDDNFVRTAAYAKLVVAEVPANKRLETTIALFRSSGDGENVRLISAELIPTLSDEERRSFYAVVSSELRTSNEDDPLFRTFQMLTADMWPELHEISRARTEARVVKHLEAGSVTRSGHTNADGALVTWARSHFKTFSRSTRWQIVAALHSKLAADDAEARRFVLKWMIPTLAELAEAESTKKMIVRSLVSVTSAEDDDLLGELTKGVSSLSDWKEMLLEAFEPLRDRCPDLLHAIEESDEVPF